MATYYRWRQSNIEYTPVEGPELTQENKFTFVRNISEASSYTLNYGQGYSVESDGSLALTNPRTAKLYYSTSTYRIINMDGNEVYLGLPHQGDHVLHKCEPALNGSEGYVVVLAKNSRSPSAWVFASSVKEFTVEASKGSSIGYVYSTSSSAYPNGGVQGDYYYDQRTTVKSPTGVTSIDTPSPITTPTVTVSWNAATSNVPQYPVSSYEVSYSTNGGTSWTIAGTTSNTSFEVKIPIGATLIWFRIRAKDSNNQWGPYLTTSQCQILLAPTLTVPQMVMQGQQATISWSPIEGADSYTLQRKSNTDADWTQVYSGANLSYSETVGTWTSVQYRVQAVFSGTPGGWAESAAIPVVSSSALVISGTDGDLGTVVNDIPYSISTDTGNQITATITVNSAVIFSGNVGNSTSDTIPVLDLVNGEGTIVIEASVTASGGPVSAVRTWTYTKAPITFPNAGSVAQLTQQGANIWPKTLAECVRLPGGGTLDEVMGFPCQIYTGSYVGTGTSGSSNPNTLTFPFEPKVWGILTFPSAGGAQATSTNLIPWGITPVVIQSTSSVCAYDGNTVNFYNATSAANQCNTSGATYYYIALG